MGLTGCYGIIKFLVVIANFIFWLFGLGIIVLAIWMLVDPTFLISMTQYENNYYIGLYLLLAVGILMLVVAFLGCCGAFKESQCMLVGFFSCLLIIFVAGIAAGAWAYINAEDLEKIIRYSTKATVESDYKTVELRRMTFDAIQSGLHCCGAEGPHDWARSKDGKLNISVTADALKYVIPASCCTENILIERCEKDRQIEGVISNSIYKEGCSEKLVEAIRQNAYIIVAVGFGLALFEFLGLIFACILVYAVKQSDRYKA